jgi:hypothetical protein
MMPASRTVDRRHTAFRRPPLDSRQFARVVGVGWPRTIAALWSIVPAHAKSQMPKISSSGWRTASAIAAPHALLSAHNRRDLDPLDYGDDSQRTVIAPPSDSLVDVLRTTRARVTLRTRWFVFGVLLGVTLATLASVEIAPSVRAVRVAIAGALRAAEGDPTKR